MLNKVSIFTLSFLIVSLVTLIFILTSDFISEYLIGYGVPISIICGFALIAFVLSLKNK
jgi:hypothetical protein